MRRIRIYVRRMHACLHGRESHRDMRTASRRYRMVYGEDGGLFPYTFNNIRAPAHAYVHARRLPGPGQVPPGLA